MKVVIVQTPEYPRLMPSLGVGYLIGILKKRGYDVKVFDLVSILEDPFDYRIITEEKINEWSELILKENPDIIGFSVYSTSVDNSLRIVDKIKNDNIKILFGGPGVLDKFEFKKIKNNKSVDYIITHEAEISFAEILDKIREKKEIPKIINSVTPKDLDNLPYPEFFIEDINIKNNPYILPIAGSRGCIHECTFCAHRLLYPYYRQRTPKSVVDEMIHQKNKYNIDTFWFCDNLLNFNNKRLESLSDEIIKRNISVYWGGYLSANNEIPDKICKNLYESGCRFFRIGIDSASRKVLDHMNKKYDIRTAEKVIKNLYTNHIFTRLSIIVGYPVEESEDFYETFKFLAFNHNYINTFVHFKFEMESGMYKQGNPLLEIEQLPKHITSLRLEILKVFTNCLTGKDSTLFLITKDYRDFENKKKNTNIFKKPLLINNYNCTNNITKIDNILRINSSLNEFEKKLNNYNELFLSITYDGGDNNNIKEIIKKIPNNNKITISKPIPKCIKLDKTKLSCNDCIEFLKIKNNEIYACKKYFKILKNNNPDYIKCKNCIFFKRKQCLPCHYLNEEKCFQKA